MVVEALNKTLELPRTRWMSIPFHVRSVGCGSQTSISHRRRVFVSQNVTSFPLLRSDAALMPRKTVTNQRERETFIGCRVFVGILLKRQIFAAFVMMLLFRLVTSSKDDRVCWILKKTTFSGTCKVDTVNHAFSCRRQGEKWSNDPNVTHNEPPRPVSNAQYASALMERCSPLRLPYS